MNFLAHAYLSGDDSKLMVGNFMGDFVKGKDYQLFEPDIARGIILHRAIDEYTDNHPIVSQSKDRLRSKYRHYAGVLIDIFYDHFLAVDWEEYHDKDLLSFTKNLYDILERHKDILPEKMNWVLGYMKRDNWLYHYSSLTGIERALHGMARRTKFRSRMDEGIDDLKRDYDDYRVEFSQFLPEVKSFVENWRPD